MNAPIPFRQSGGEHILGQPFAVLTVWVPVTMTLTCNCGGEDTTVTIAQSTPGACPSCQRKFNAVFNPTNQQIQVQMEAIGPDKEPS